MNASFKGHLAGKKIIFSRWGPIFASCVSLEDETVAERPSMWPYDDTRRFLLLLLLLPYLFSSVLRPAERGSAPRRLHSGQAAAAASEPGVPTVAPVRTVQYADGRNANVTALMGNGDVILRKGQEEAGGSGTYGITGIFTVFKVI